MSEALRQVFALALHLSPDVLPHDVPLATMARMVGYRLRRLKRDEIQLKRLTHVLIAADDQGSPCAIRRAHDGNRDGRAPRGPARPRGHALRGPVAERETRVRITKLDDYQSWMISEGDEHIVLEDLRRATKVVARTLLDLLS